MQAIVDCLQSFRFSLENREERRSEGCKMRREWDEIRVRETRACSWRGTPTLMWHAFLVHSVPFFRSNNRQAQREKTADKHGLKTLKYFYSKTAVRLFRLEENVSSGILKMIIIS